MVSLCDKILRFNFLLLLVLIQFYVAPALSAEAEPSGSYQALIESASQSFNQGDYIQARDAYEQALKLALAGGKPSRALYYNLGSVYYKLQQYDQSRSYFKKLLDDEKLAAIAYYNIALIENKENRQGSAVHYLNKSKQASTDAQLSKLIDQQLLKLKTDGPVKTKTSNIKDWHAYLYLSPGYDSNIKFAPLEVASNESGSFIQGIAIFDKVIAGGSTAKKQALLFTSSIFLSNYFSTDFNDYNLFDIGLRYLLPAKQWRNSIDLNIKKSTYGHTDYQKIYAATFKTRRRFSGGDVLRLRYRYEQIDSLDSLYDYLQGSRQRLRLGYQFKWPKDSVFLWYELELNNRQNTERRNYSPTRNTVRLRYEKKFNPKNAAYAEYEYRYSDYEPTAFQDRLDKRNGILLAYVYDIKPDWQLLARWGFRSNRSTDTVFSYDRHVVLLTLRKSF